jgi:hypothetical protein
VGFHAVMPAAECAKICGRSFTTIFPSFGVVDIGTSGRLSAARKPASAIARD